MVGAIYLDVATKRDDGRVALNAFLKMTDVAAEFKPGQRTVVPQGAVNRMLVRSLVTCRSDRWLDGYYRKLRAMASARP